MRSKIVLGLLALGFLAGCGGGRAGAPTSTPIDGNWIQTGFFRVGPGGQVVEHQSGNLADRSQNYVLSKFQDFLLLRFSNNKLRLTSVVGGVGNDICAVDQPFSLQKREGAEWLEISAVEGCDARSMEWNQTDQTMRLSRAGQNEKVSLVFERIEKTFYSEVRKQVRL